MNDLRNIVLADTAFARYKHGKVGRSHCHGHFQCAVERRIIADNVVFILKFL